MSVVTHFFGTAGRNAIPEIKRALEGLAPLFAGAEGYERAELLVNHAELKVQFLLQFSSVEACTAFLRQHGRELVLPFKAVVQNASPPFLFALETEIDARAR